MRATRRERERKIVSATKDLFDARGMRDAQIGDVARAVGINKAQIYRHFSSKEELYVQTVVLYLVELEERLATIDEKAHPVLRLLECSRLYIGYCLDHPAFLDCCLSLMRVNADDLRETVSGGVMFNLGTRMARCLAVIAAILRDGAEQGVFEVDDPDEFANYLYTRTLGAVHLSRAGVGVRIGEQGLAEAFPFSRERIERLLIEDTLAGLGVDRKDRRVKRWWASRFPLNPAA